MQQVFNRDSDSAAKSALESLIVRCENDLREYKSKESIASLTMA
jgi:hypothetical protein